MTNKIGRHIFTVLLLTICVNAFGQRGRMRMNQAQREPNFNRQNQYQYHPFNQGRPFGQPNDKQAMVIRIKENFVHKQLGLTSEQSARFLPLYHQYQMELFGIQKLKRLNNTDAPNGADQIQKNLDYERQIVDIKARYTQEFLRIMPPEKVSLITKSEREFNDEIFRQPAERSPVLSPPANP